LLNKDESLRLYKLAEEVYLKVNDGKYSLNMRTLFCNSITDMNDLDNKDMQRYY
jgi:hypothetical protein